MNENEISDDLLERARAEQQFRQMILEYMQANTDALNGISAAIVSLGQRVEQIENDLRTLQGLVSPDSDLPS